ncbi:MAG: electron transfer flavoprotein subunit alpha/FixB family protein [Dehalococcoidia bacterium]|nr:electron transfer flavoprotein subunit alpha/FixB family protein [Dehalococcoidia bacterium]
MAQDVLVVGEVANGAITTTTTELLNAGKTLAEGGAVAITLLGASAAGAAASAFAAGATKVFSSADAAYDDFKADQWTAAVDGAIGQLNPGVVLLAQSPVGRDLGPRLAFRRNTAVAMDCVGVALEGGAVKATRPCYGGNALSVYGFATSPAIATVRAKSFDPAPPAAGASGETVDLGAAAASNIEIVGMEAAVSEGLKLEEAPIVVSGGRGLGDADGFRIVEALAEAFGRDKATTGASRAAVDLGWYPPAKQVGLTGKVVTPDLYVAVAISGASQHMAGCSGSKMIVAINRDKEANIFKAAKYGLVGDYKALVPALIAAVKAAK